MVKLGMFYKKYHNFIFAVLPLFIGGLIYICFRNENILFFSWLRFFYINYSFLRQINIGSNVVSSYIIYNLPHGLWVLSGLLILKIFLENEKNILLFYSIIFILMSVFNEIGQFYSIIRGTFDILDLFTIIIFSSVGLVINLIGKRYEKV
jgi:hypothetical protein